jgi:NADPH-dependent 2,4-dienoyl-CoA reductase/sulfur reductase-like enzyme
LFRTLVGSGLKDKYTLRRPLAELIPTHITHHPEHVATFSPESNSLTTAGGGTIQYDALVVAAGLKINWDGIANLPNALADPRSGVSSIYSFDTADKTWADIEVWRDFSYNFDLILMIIYPGFEIWDSVVYPTGRWYV